MSARLTREQVAEVAALARLTVTEEELDTYTEQLASILEHADDMESLDIEGVEPTAHPYELANVLRPDVVRPSVDRDEVLAVAPAAEDGRFRVPAILGEEP